MTLFYKITFALTEVEIDQIIRGTDSLQTINILQTKSSVDPYSERGKDVLLFLTEYDGPITDNAYEINGLYHGHFQIEGNSIKNVASLNDIQLVTSKLDDIITDIKNTEYKPITTKKQEAKDIEEQNEQEKKLKEQLESLENGE